MEKTFSKINGTDLEAVIASIIIKPFLYVYHIKLQRGHPVDLTACVCKYNSADSLDNSDFSTDCSAAVLWQHHINEPAEVPRSMWLSKFNPVPQTSPTLHNADTAPPNPAIVYVPG